MGDGAGLLLTQSSISPYGLWVLEQGARGRRRGVVCRAEVRAVSPDLAVGVADHGQIASHHDDRHLPPRHRAWLRRATHLLYPEEK